MRRFPRLRMAVLPAILIMVLMFAGCSGLPTPLSLLQDAYNKTEAAKTLAVQVTLTQHDNTGDSKVYVEAVVDNENSKLITYTSLTGPDGSKFETNLFYGDKAIYIINPLGTTDYLSFPVALPPESPDSFGSPAAFLADPEILKTIEETTSSASSANATHAITLTVPGPTIKKQILETWTKVSQSDEIQKQLVSALVQAFGVTAQQASDALKGQFEAQAKQLEQELAYLDNGSVKYSAYIDQNGYLSYERIEATGGDRSLTVEVHLSLFNTPNLVKLPEFTDKNTTTFADLIKQLKANPQ